MSTPILTFELPEVNADIFLGIPCHDAGQPYPCWCPGCLEEGDSRELIALRTQQAAHAACDYRIPAEAPDVNAYGGFPEAESNPSRRYARSLAAMALLNAIEDEDMEQWL